VGLLYVEVFGKPSLKENTLTPTTYILRAKTRRDFDMAVDRIQGMHGHVFVREMNVTPQAATVDNATEDQIAEMEMAFKNEGIQARFCDEI